ncbi:hypothetical protein Tco_0902007 [Tanacetum coccineum]
MEEHENSGGGREEGLKEEMVIEAANALFSMTFGNDVSKGDLGIEVIYVAARVAEVSHRPRSFRVNVAVGTEVDIATL